MKSASLTYANSYFQFMTAWRTSAISKVAQEQLLGAGVYEGRYLKCHRCSLFGGTSVINYFSKFVTAAHDKGFQKTFFQPFGHSFMHSPQVKGSC